MKLLASILFLLIFSVGSLFGQEVPILNYSLNNNGQVQLEVASSTDKYYILKVRDTPEGEFKRCTSMTLGEEGTTIITESLEAYPAEHYQVLEYAIDDPADADGDGVDDMTEYADLPTQGPFNFAEPVDFVDGSVSLDDFNSYKALSITGENVPFASYLNGLEFVKFIIIDPHSDHPKLYFVNTETHERHQYFTDAIGVDITAIEEVRGEVIFYPTTISNNGTLGTFSFSYSVGLWETFETVRQTHELIAANMPFLKNNLSYYVTKNSKEPYEENKALFEDSRVPILLEDDVYADIDYLAMNAGEGYGFFRVMSLEETPGSRDIVLYESLPNSMPRVGGIITSVIQTPLSHVNIRAIQDNLPNAFIRDPLLVDSLANLLGKYIYYRVDQGSYFVREATIEEVNNWYDGIRPNEEQTPILNLSYTDILPLDDITFDMSDGFGAKSANVATMRTFGFPDGTIPDGFAVPFYYYQEFMKYNGFFEEVEEMLADQDFQSDLNTRIEMLEDFRDDIEDADMPQWMLDDLQAMQESFPAGTSIRCRSSTNNEDLPGFSGAGLYSSKTQHPEEGHISKSIKQVFASMWNFRAFDERDFYRVDQFIASMGVLCHPNYTDEKANGVAVSTDPIYQTDNTFYLNTQVGEDLVTNPGELSLPEEILLDRESVTEDDFLVIRNSNLVEDGELIMDEGYLDEMRVFLSTIHDEFAILYNAVGKAGFAMDIEYKITKDDQLIVKQARPWAAYWSSVENSVSDPENESIEVRFYPNPVKDYLNVQCNCSMAGLRISDMAGQMVSEISTGFRKRSLFIPTFSLPEGMYILSGIDESGNILFSEKIVKMD